MAWVPLVAALIFGLLPSWAGASEAPEDASSEETAGLADEGPWDTGQSDAGMALWFWPEGGRFFQLTDVQPGVAGISTVTAYDLENRMPVGDPAELDPAGWSTGPETEYYSANGRHHTAALDREHGRFFVAYKTGVTGTPTATALQREASEVVGEAPCAAMPVAVRAGCVSGVHVIDGVSMEKLGQIRLDLPTVEGPRAHPVPKALEYAPAVPERGWGGRVLMVVEEQAPNVWEGSQGHQQVALTTNTIPRRSGGAVVYAVGLDPESMRQEWAVRVEGCRNSREERAWQLVQLSHPVTVFRSGGDDPALYVGCHGNASQQGVVVRIPLDADGIPASLPLRAGDPVASADPGADDTGLGGLAEPAPRQEVFSGPDSVRQILSDPASQRILMRVEDSGEVWWVFDGTTNQFIGTVGIGGYALGHTYGGLDPDTGRLYVLAGKTADAPGGLYVADIRRNPLPQALHYPHLADPSSSHTPLTAQGGTSVGREMSVQPRAGGAVARLFTTRQATSANGVSFRVIADATPVSVDAERDDSEILRTLDLDEAAGVTDATFDGTARGFGFRAILIGGVEGATRVGPADPVGTVRGVQQLEGGKCLTLCGPLLAALPQVPTFPIGTESTVAAPLRQVVPPDPCSDAQRELIVAFVGPRGSAVVDASSARGETQPVLADTRTQQDAEAPVTRCGPMDWPELWQSALVSQPPVSEPGVAWPFADSRSSCTASGEGTDDASWSDPVLGMFSSRVECSEDQVGGWGQARGVNVDGVSVANTLSTFKIYRDPERGLVARVESIARGIDVGGVVKIDTIRGVAESWANGRTPTDDEEAVEAGEEVFNPWNCDRSRPAGTCFERHVFGVRVMSPDGSQGYRCGPCGDEDALIEGMNRGFGAYGMARFREPDRDLARGSADGYMAAVTKKDAERFSDIVMNADLLETMVPMLEVIRYAPHNRQENTAKNDANYYRMGTPPRGRQVYQFAAVEVSSTYSVQCLLVYDEATNTCAEAAEVPGSIQVSLSDPDGQPLAGGAFEVREDVDADGVLGLKDTLLPDGACVTAEDGIGTCTFENLQPGTYLVNQVAAPPGYAKSAEPWVSAVASGEQRTVAFTNVSNVSTIDMTVTDENGAPLSGATFAAYPDPDADGKIAPDAQPAATCTTDAAGVCSMQVPAGSYVLVQTGAPGGLEGIEPVAFTFASGGQVAAVTVVNYPPSQPAAPEGAASPTVVDYTAPVGYRPPVESVSGSYVPGDIVDAPTAAGPSVPEQIGGTVVRVVRAPGDALRLLSRDPQQAVAFTAALALLVLALLAVRRRQLLGGLTAVPAFAFTGGGTPPPPLAPPRPSGPAGGPGPSGGGPGGSSGGDPGGRSAPPSGSSPQGSGPTPSTSPASSSGGGGSTVMASTAVLDRPIMGAAPSAMEQVHASVLVATASPVLAAMVTGRLSGADRVTLLAAVDSLEELRATSSKLDADVLVVDVGFPAGRPGDVYDIVAGLHPADRVVALIPADAAVETMVTRCLEAGFAGVLAVDGDIGNGNLAYTVRQVAAGKPCYGPTVQAVLRNPAVLRTMGRKRGRPRIVALTEREREVAELAAQGLSRIDIADKLCLSPWTVKRHLHEARTKLGIEDARDRDELRRRLDATKPDQTSSRAASGLEDEDEGSL